ncbi:MAG: terminase small subunit [Candidatus Paceibacterota bacterium]|jgi:hypothetical protein
MEEKRPVGRPLKFQSVEELEKKIDEYFETTGWKTKEVYDKKKQEVVTVPYYEPATITGMAVFLDTSRETISDYREKPEYADAIKKAKDKCEYSIEYGALTNNLNPAMAIFSAKNNYGWSDKTEIDHTSKGESIGVIILPPKQ